MICPRCGNNDVNDPEVCTKCGAVLKVNNEKIGARDSWKKNEYQIKKDKDINFIKIIIIIILLVMLIAGAIIFGVKTEVFSNKKTIIMPDSLTYITTINSYITESNKDNNTYKVNDVSYTFYPVPSSKYCTYHDGKYNNTECEYFFKDIQFYCKSLVNSCVMPPNDIEMWFDDTRVKNGSTFKFENTECTYNLINEDDPYNSDNVKCYQPKQ